MATQTIITYIFVSLFGLVIGSFLNVCIYRIPKKEDLVFTRSHCMGCGHQLQWYELVPVFSYLVQRGRCRKCKMRISIQYPMIELVNAIGYVWIFAHHGVCIESVFQCLITSVLIVISVIDERTLEIPVGCNYFILLIGVIHMALDYQHWYIYVLGMISVSGFLLLVYLITRGKGIGGGDIKFMFACGLFLGIPQILLAFILGCVLASVIHIIRMKVSKAEHVLAFGPYLCTGVWITMLYGYEIIQWYIGIC